MLIIILTQGLAFKFVLLGTDAETLALLNTTLAPFSSDISQISSYQELLDFEPSSIDFLIYLELDELSKFQIMSFSNENQIFTLVLGGGQNSEYIFYTDPDPECLSGSLLSMSNVMNKAKVAVIWSYSGENAIVVNKIMDKLPRGSIQLSVVKSTPLSEISEMFAKIIKIGAFQDLIVVSDYETCLNISTAFRASFFHGKGRSGLFTEECIDKGSNECSVFLVNKVLDNVSDKYTALVAKVLKYFNIFKEKNLSKGSLKKSLEQKIENCEFNIVNYFIVKRTVGTMKDYSIKLNDTIVYYGAVINRTGTYTPKLTISANTGSFNPLNHPESLLNQKYQEGTYFAIEKLNRDRKICSNYKFVLYDSINCGVSVFDYNYSLNCINPIVRNLGLAYIPTESPITSKFLNQMASINRNIPFVGGLGDFKNLSSRADYPYYIRMVTPIDYSALAWQNMINIYNWDKIMLYYTNDDFGASIYNIMNNKEKTRQYEIINSEQYREVSNINNSESIQDYYENMKEGIKLGCNIVFLAMSESSAYFWLEGLYDLGVRRGDLTFIFFTMTGLDSFTGSDDSVNKRKELMHGSFLIYNAAWVGEYGHSLKKEYLNYGNDTWGRSYYIDATYLIAETVEYMMQRGKIYENKTELMGYLRMARIKGATGEISFDKSSNDRSVVYLGLFNFYEESPGEWKHEEIALISSLSTVYLNVFKDSVWPTGQIPPSMKKNYKNCSFREEKIKTSSLGSRIKLAVSLILLLLTTTLTIIKHKKFKYTNIEMLSKQTLASFEDYLTLGYLIIEPLQVISLGPDFGSFNRFVSNVSEIVSLNLSQVVLFRDRNFWIIYYLVLGLSYIWLIILLLSGLKIERCSKTWGIRINRMKLLSIPIMSNYLFLPIVIGLFNIFMCDDGIGNEGNEAFLNYDCNFWCWKGSHIFLGFLAGTQIIVYVPLAIVYRTIWQTENQSLNIRTNSNFLVVKNLLLVIFVILAKTIKNDYEIVHSILFISLQAFILIFIVALKGPFNYDRANLMAKVMVICVIWNTLVCIIRMFTQVKLYVLLIIQVCGWAGVFIFGLILVGKVLKQNFLVSKSGASVTDLFKFSFGLKEYTGHKYLNRSGKIAAPNSLITGRSGISSIAVE